MLAVVVPLASIREPEDTQLPQRLIPPTRQNSECGPGSFCTTGRCSLGKEGNLYGACLVSCVFLALLVSFIPVVVAVVVNELRMKNTNVFAVFQLSRSTHDLCVRLIATRIDRNSFGGDFFAMLVNRSQLWFTRTSIAE